MPYIIDICKLHDFVLNQEYQPVPSTLYIFVMLRGNWKVQVRKDRFLPSFQKNLMIGNINDYTVLCNCFEHEVAKLLLGSFQSLTYILFHYFSLYFLFIDITVTDAYHLIPYCKSMYAILFTRSFIYKIINGMQGKPFGYIHKGTSLCYVYIDMLYIVYLLYY